MTANMAPKRFWESCVRVSRDRIMQCSKLFHFPLACCLSFPSLPLFFFRGKKATSGQTDRHAVSLKNGREKNLGKRAQPKNFLRPSLIRMTPQLFSSPSPLPLSKSRSGWLSFPLLPPFGRSSHFSAKKESLCCLYSGVEI